MCNWTERVELVMGLLKEESVPTPPAISALSRSGLNALRHRKLSMALLFAVYVFSNIDGVALALVLQDIKRDLL